jgi:uncharacterized protein (TIGR03000 family)
MEKLPNQLKTHRISRGWSQAELAQRAGISRAAVSAIEIKRLVPSVAAALGLAQALGCSVEDLFTGNADQPKEALWAWPPSQDSCRYWHATLGRRTLLYPVETTAAGMANRTTQPSIDPNAVVISLRVPANAEVLIDGNKTSQNGAVRDFVTPPLETGRQFSYDIKARWSENGRPVERERHVNFHAGDRLMVNMMTTQVNGTAATQRSTTPAYGAVP